jgi:hypothetical protein
MAGYDIARNVASQPFTLTDYYKRYGRYFPIWSNELGCFDRPIGRVVHPVLLLGDSFTWGYTPFEATWGSRLERELGLRVLKCGVGGYGTRQALLKFRGLLPAIPTPALVVLGYYIGNDLMDDYLFPQATVWNGYLAGKIGLVDETTGQRQTRSAADLAAAERAALTPPRGAQRVKLWMSRHSIVYNLLRDNVQIRALLSRLGLAAPSPSSSEPLQFRDPASAPWLNTAWHDHLETLRGFDQLVRQSGSRLLVVVFPTREQIYEFLRPSNLRAIDWERPNRRLQALFERNGIESLDLFPEFRRLVIQRFRHRLDPDQDFYWTTNGHLNLVGNHLAALLIGRYLLTHQLVPSDSLSARVTALDAELAGVKVR